MRLKRDLLDQIFSATGMAVLERDWNLGYKVLAAAPPWLQEFGIEVSSTEGSIELSETFPFLEHFLTDAEEFWHSGQTGILRSGPWVEFTVDREERHLEALALSLDGAAVLLLQMLAESYDERRALLQRARENSLNHQRLIREVQQKEVLLHCIVHDLAGPLTGLKGFLTLFEREELTEKARRRLRIGQESVDKLDRQIRDLLEVFSAELDASQVFFRDPARAPNLSAAVDFVVETLQPAAAVRNIRFEIQPGLAVVGPCRVVGESTRLERVLFNLLENALRYSPTGSKVVVRIETDDVSVRVSVIDRGPGVEPEMIGQLFKRFVKGNRGGGKAGLGLYFCRIVLKRWGGEIEYQAGPEGESIFSFSLPRIGS